MSRSGLKKVTKTVRGKHGSVRRSYWVKAQEGAKNVGQKIWRNKGKIATGFAGAAIATGIYLHKRKLYAAKEAGIRTAMSHADYRVDAQNSLRAIGLDPRRPASQTPIVRGDYTTINPEAARRNIVSRRANVRAYEVRQYGNAEQRTPLQLGSGETPKPKRSRKKK